MEYISENLKDFVILGIIAFLGGCVVYNAIHKWLFRSSMVIFVGLIALAINSQILESVPSSDYTQLVQDVEGDIESTRITDYMDIEGVNWKRGVNVDNLKLPMYIVIPAIVGTYKSVVGRHYNPTITSGNDSRHASNSKHYDDMALDFRTNDINRWKSRQIANRLKAYLGRNYTVIFEDEGSSNEHLHIQYDGLKSKREMYHHMATYEASKHKVDPNLIVSIVKAESDFNSNVVSHAGAIGLMQLMPSTASDLGVNPHNPYENLKGGVRYIKYLIDRYDGNVELALVSYHCGMGHVDSAIAVAGTRNWQKVVASMNISAENKRLTYKYVNRITEEKEI